MQLSLTRLEGAVIGMHVTDTAKSKLIRTMHMRSLELI